MKRSLFHIILAFLLTFAVTDYLWVELLGNEKVSVELETEKEQESEEEIREDRSPESKHEYLDFYYTTTPSFHFQRQQELITTYNSFGEITERSKPKLFILHKQLRIHC